MNDADNEQCERHFARVGLFVMEIRGYGLDRAEVGNLSGVASSSLGKTNMSSLVSLTAYAPRVHNATSTKHLVLRSAKIQSEKIKEGSMHRLKPLFL
ncbi:hypothetical protein [Entomobacter blattae]|uniref:hypothetical protein n=1 Tax=Entomobacter blattae TaxID=2762277 RepID=UPI00193C6D17|nr:hypothetical protein [Entomobacter blattae]